MPSLNQLLELLETERKERELQKVSKRLYEEIAEQIRSLKRADRSGEKSIIDLIAEREAELLLNFGVRIMEVRMEKVASSMAQGIDESSLTDEEKYVAEAISETSLRKLRVIDALANGRKAPLKKVSRIIASRKRVVRFLKPSPAFVGMDLATYGPFQKEDIALLPLENAKALLRQGMVEGVWVEEPWGGSL